MASASLTRINTNIQAMNALNALNKVNSKMSMHQLRLATGKRINSAADDAAGFTIASKLKVKASGLGTALDNIGSSKNLMTVAEGHLTNIQDMLSKMKSKAQQAANGTLGSDERLAVLAELDEFNTQIDAEVEQATWAGTTLLGDNDLKFQIGTGEAASDELTFNVVDNVSLVSAFDSAGLDVTASTGTDSVSATVLASQYVTAATDDFDVAAAFDHTDEIAGGHYTVNVTTATSGADSVITIQLLDSEGAAVTLDANGVSGSNETGTTLSTTVAGTFNPGSIDLGVGITLDLGAISTSTAGHAVYAVEYTSAHNVEDQDAAQAYMGKIDTAISKVTQGLSYIGSQINRLSFQEESLSVAKVNTESAYSRIVDADMAFEQLEATKMMILQQTATAMLAQANTAPQSVLSLFG
ncbi:flagellin [bacterium]|nr:flagellin [bacterium]